MTVLIHCILPRYDSPNLMNLLVGCRNRTVFTYLAIGRYSPPNSMTNWLFSTRDLANNRPTGEYGSPSMNRTRAMTKRGIIDYQRTRRTYLEHLGNGAKLPRFLRVVQDLLHHISIPGRCGSWAQRATSQTALERSGRAMRATERMTPTASRYQPCASLHLAFLTKDC